MAKDVQIGEQTYTVQRFSTFKAIRAGEIVSAIMQRIPDLSERISEFTKKFREENSISLSRAAAELRYPEDVAEISEKAWEESGGKIEIPASPGPMDIAAKVFPFVFDAAKDEALELIALLAISNSDLQRADAEDQVDEEIAKMKRRLIHEDAAGLVDLCLAAATVFEDQFEGKAKALRQAASSFGLRGTEATETNEPTVSEQPTSTTSKPSTSPDSPDRSDGLDARSSTRSPSEPAAVSSSG